MPLPVIAVTVGDPSGIGPEVAVKAARDPRVVDVCRPVLYGPHTPDDLARFPCGRIDPESARAAYQAIVRASSDALVPAATRPVQTPARRACPKCGGWLVEAAGNSATAHETSESLR